MTFVSIIGDSMNLTKIYLEEMVYIRDFMFHHNMNLYRDNNYKGHSWRIEINYGGSCVSDFANRFSLTYNEFKKIMCYNCDCLFNGQLFGFKTENDAKIAIYNLCRYARGDKDEFN